MPADQYTSYQVGVMVSGLLTVVVLAIVAARKLRARAKPPLILCAVMLLVATLSCSGANPWGTRPESIPTPASVRAPQTSIGAAQPATIPSPSATVAPPAALPQEPMFAPEQPATSVDQVAGMWDVSHTSEGYAHEAILAFALDGSYETRYSGQDPSAGLAIDIGTYLFDQDVLVLQSNYCWKGGDVYTCTARYHVFVAMAEDAPGKLRFVLVEDPDANRAKYLAGKTHLPPRQE